jgi:hypothetical protein
MIAAMMSQGMGLSAVGSQLSANHLADGWQPTAISTLS